MKRSIPTPDRCPPFISVSTRGSSFRRITCSFFKKTSQRICRNRIAGRASRADGCRFLETGTLRLSRRALCIAKVSPLVFMEPRKFAGVPRTELLRSKAYAYIYCAVTSRRKAERPPNRTACGKRMRSESATASPCAAPRRGSRRPGVRRRAGPSAAAWRHHRLATARR
jgi:hypothetical protein